MKDSFTTVDAYIGTFPPEVQARLQEIREIIHEAAPEATEAISYQMPTFKLHDNLVHFAAWKNHIGFYALPSAHEAFAEELSKYKSAKGSAQFPHDQPLPRGLIKKMVRHRVKEHLAKKGKKLA